PSARLDEHAGTWDSLSADGANVRLSYVRNAGPPPFAVVSLMATAALDAENRRVALLLLLSAPVVALISLGAGYVLARRALRPVRAMTDEIAGIDAGDLGKRLAVRANPDELDTLATQ